MIASLSQNDFANIANALAGKFGWSEKDPERRFYLQNVVIGSVETRYDNQGKPYHCLKPYGSESGEPAILLETGGANND